MIYLDANASEPMLPAARAAMQVAMDCTGNPSSVHAAGRAARRLLEDARDSVARRFGLSPANVVFTSGGTEACALAVHGLGRGRRLIIGATEHDAVRAQAIGQNEIIPVDRDGVADLAALERLLQGEPALVCLMLANNETGTIQPIAEAARLCRTAGAWLHVDAAQAAGRMTVDMVALGAQSVAVSGHKMGGAPGAGALLLDPSIPDACMIRGGGQERGRRSGTPALATIAALGAAAREPPADLHALRDELEQEAVGSIVIASRASRLGNTACLALSGVSAQLQVMTLDLAGIAVSAGAACSSGRIARSHVLEAMGLGTLAGEAIRVSLPWNTTGSDVAAFGIAWRAMASRLCRSAA